MMWLRKPVECRQATRSAARVTILGQYRRLTSLDKRGFSRPLAGLLLWSVLAMTGCAAPQMLCRTDCHVPGGVTHHHAGPKMAHHSGPKMARPLLPHRQGHAWTAHAADFGYSRTFWQRFPGQHAHGMMPWVEEIPQADGEWRDRESSQEPERMPTEDSEESSDERDFLPSPSDQPEPPPDIEPYEPPNGLDSIPEDANDSDDELDLPPFLPTSASISDEREEEGLTPSDNFAHFRSGQSGVVRRVPEPLPEGEVIRAASFSGGELSPVSGPVRVAPSRQDAIPAESSAVPGYTAPQRTRFGSPKRNEATEEAKFPGGGGLLRLFSR